MPQDSSTTARSRRIYEQKYNIKEVNDIDDNGVVIVHEPDPQILAIGTILGE